MYYHILVSLQPIIYSINIFIHFQVSCGLMCWGLMCGVLPGFSVALIIPVTAFTSLHSHALQSRTHACKGHTNNWTDLIHSEKQHIVGRNWNAAFCSCWSETILFKKTTLTWLYWINYSRQKSPVISSHFRINSSSPWYIGRHSFRSQIFPTKKTPQVLK